ncbi:MAG: glycosyltransferase family 39 protein, partial [Planctomycetota bacterium]
MLFWTWRTWPDPLVDFGRELYIPWQLSQGKVLYADVTTHSGPLSQYWNAVWFYLFGASLTVLVVCNLVLLALLIAVLYYVFGQAGGRFSATASCLVFVALFAFAQFVRIGNYNYVCPYAHEMTHGVLVSLIALVSIWSYPAWGLRAPLVSGLALGLAFLTKVEVFLPGAVAAAAAMLLMICARRHSRRRGLAALGVLAMSAAVPPVLAFAALCAAMPAGEALIGTLGSWVVLANRQVTGLKFYSEGMGTSDISGNLRIMLVWSGWYAAVLVPCGLAGLALRKKKAYAWVIAAAVFAGLAALLLGCRRSIPWAHVARPLPLFMLISGVALFILFLRHRRTADTADRFIRRISLTVLAFVMLLKMILNARINQYGFVLAMPATLVLVTALLDWLPAAVGRLGGHGVVLRAAALALIFCGAATYLSIQHHMIRR